MLGELTYTDLGDSDAFSPLLAPDAWGVLRAPFSPRLARMSAELAADVYQLAITPWMKAGWADCTFAIEDRIVVLDRESESRLAAIESEWKRHRAKSLLNGTRPIGDLVRAARQFVVTDMGKSVVMTRLLPDGRAVIAISFIGTTQKFYDWFTNFKFQRGPGMHYGFLELARQFDGQAARVALPGLAAALGRESLTLADVLLEARHPESRYVFWLSGHSQGGALVQTYAHLLLERGVAPSTIHGYSFAAPTVTACGGVVDPKAYPIYNIINADDIVPRVGAHVRLGVDLIYHPDDAFRAAHYRVDEALCPAFERMRFLAAHVNTTEDAFCWGIVFMRLMAAMDPDGEKAVLAGIFPHQSWLRRMGISPAEIALFFEAKLTEHYRALAGGEPDPVLCARYEEIMRDAEAEFGVEKTAKALLKALALPHRIQPDKKEEAYVPPYIAIVRRYLSETERGVWSGDAPARCVDRNGEILLPLRPPGVPRLSGTRAALGEGKYEDE